MATSKPKKSKAESISTKALTRLLFFLAVTLSPAIGVYAQELDNESKFTTRPEVARKQSPVKRESRNPIDSESKRSPSQSDYEGWAITTSSQQSRAVRAAEFKAVGISGPGLSVDVAEGFETGSGGDSRPPLTSAPGFEALYLPAPAECVYVLPGTDYTQIYSFDFAKAHTATRLVTIECEYVDRAGVNPSNAIEQFLGNIFIVTQSDLLSLSFLDYEQRVNRFWIRYDNDLNGWTVLLAQLPQSQKILVTFDPDCGLVTKVEILSWRASW